MRVLVIGGTGFIGWVMVQEASSRGHDVTVLHRGHTRADLPKGVTELIGDRNAPDGFDAVGTDFDVVIDTCGYLPAQVMRTAEALDAAARRYLFISSLSVYAPPIAAGLTEADVAALHAPAGPEVDAVTGETYGPLKVACEQALADRLGDRVTVLRPGLVAGPGDPTGRFTYWPLRVAAGGEVLLPPAGTTLQLIDVRDLAPFAIDLVEREQAGTWNAVGPTPPATFADLFEVCMEVAGVAAVPVHADDLFLLDHDVAPWSSLPLWIPGAAEEAGMTRFDCSRAAAAGLRVRPLRSTAAHTLAWARNDDGPGTLAAGPVAGRLTREHEAAVVRAWRARPAAVTAAG